MTTPALRREPSDAAIDVATAVYNEATGLRPGKLLVNWYEMRTALRAAYAVDFSPRHDPHATDILDSSDEGLV